MNRKLIRSRVDWSAQWRSSIDEDERLLLGGGLEEGVHGFEQRGFVDGATAAAARLLADLVDHPAAGREAVEGGVVAGDGGQQLGGGDLEAAEDLGEGEVGQGAVAEVEAVAGDDLPAEVEGAVAQRGEEPGLADAGVAGEEDGCRRRAGAATVAGRDDAEPESEVLQLGISSHERGSRHRAMQPIMSGAGDIGPLVSRRWAVVPTTGQPIQFPLSPTRAA